MKRVVLLGAALAALTCVFGLSAAIAAPGDNGTACQSHPDNGVPPFCTSVPTAQTTVVNGVVVVVGDAPRGLWCNTLGVLTLPGGFMVGPLNAIDVLLVQGKALEAAGLVSAADWAPGVGAFCPGAPQVAGKTVTLAGTKVNNLGQSIPGDGGAIYNLAAVA